MAVSREVPNPLQDMYESIIEFQNNWDGLGDFYDVDHYTFDDSETANQGKHRHVTLVEQTTDQVTAIVPGTNEVIMYSKESGGLTEVFAKNDLGAEIQITKNSELFTGLKPFAAVNFEGNGSIRGTAKNVSLVTRNPGGAGNHVYKIYFAPYQHANNDYLVTVVGFDNSSNPVIANIQKNATYGNVVSQDFVIVQFRNHHITPISGLIAGFVTCWSVQ